MEITAQEQHTDSQFWRNAFDLMRMAVEVSLNPIISRKEAVDITGRRSIDNAVRSGNLIPVMHGNKMFFDRIKFYEFCRTSNPNK